MTTYRWGALAVPGDLTVQQVQEEMAKTIVHQMIRQGLTQVVGPDGIVYDIEVAVLLVAVTAPAPG